MVKSSLSNRTTHTVTWAVNVDLGLEGVGHVVDDRAQAQAAQREGGEDAPGEDGDPGGDGAAVGRGGGLVKRRCSNAVLFGVRG